MTKSTVRVFLRPALAVVVLCACLFSCRSSARTEVIKPRTHRTWYKNHVYKKKWHIGRIWIRPERQGVKKVRMK